MTATPPAWYGETSRLATTKPLDAAMAAIKPSAAGKPCPALLAVIASSAQLKIVASSIGVKRQRACVKQRQQAVERP